MAELRSDREWEHWPQERRLDDGIRRKLRALFQPTLPGERDVEEALAEHTYELELRARQLAETVADLRRARNGRASCARRWSRCCGAARPSSTSGTAS